MGCLAEASARRALLHVPCAREPAAKKTTYSADEVDVIAAYCDGARPLLPHPDRTGARQRPTIQLRLAPTLNNQKRRINWADDFDFAATLRRHQGAVAQLGERQSGTLEVRGSSPLGSIF